MTNKTVNVSLRLPPELAAHLDVVKQKTGKSRHQVIIDALTQQYNSDASTTSTSNPPATEGASNIDYILSALKSLGDRLDRLEGVRGVRNDDQPLELAVSICLSHYIRK